MADRRVGRRVAVGEEPARASTLAERVAELFNPRSDQMIWWALTGCRIGTDDKILDEIIAEHKTCPRGYCEHKKARDRHSEVIGWDD